MDSQVHWQQVHGSRRPGEVSWFQPDPEPSLRLITEVAGPPRSVVDVGAGTSLLVDRLLERGYEDVTVLDVSAAATEAVRQRLAARGRHAVVETADVLRWRPGRTFDVWHDRAAFHFLVDAEDRDRYREVLVDALAGHGHAVLATFAPDGPTHCSGLEVRRYGPDELAAEFRPALELLRSERHVHRTPWGAEQPFTWAVMRRTGAGGLRRRHLLIRGRVQGVWFRQSARDEALRLGVSGWVRNRPDGTVELAAEGPRGAVEALEAWCRVGPPLARVAVVEASDEPLQGDTGFAVTG